MDGQPTSRAGFMRRLAHYCIGLAIGLVLLGFFQQRRAAEWSARQHAREAAGNQTSVYDTRTGTPQIQTQNAAQSALDAAAGAPTSPATADDADTE
ncbi:MAG: hypothetical protein KF912_02870 [Phycisphaeraceae bacterium]|nr:hypothetical protein [Phycisphaeraceae bacterium]MBX3366243.1 hypothetical protein [Phycisphaeraceae bacterium]